MNVRISILICLLALTQGLYAQIAQFDFEENTGTTSTSESKTATSFSIANKYARPERISGVEGNALRLDGTSTWVFKDGFNLTNVNKQLTIEAWHATESFTPRYSGLVSQENATSGFTLEVGPYGNVAFSFFADGTRITMTSVKTLDTYKWNHVVGVIDLAAGYGRVYVNGEQWAQNTFATNYNSITLANTPLYIGRHSSLQSEGGFLINVLNGAVDKIRIYNTALSLSAINTNYQAHASVVPDLYIDPAVRHPNDYLRPRFHAMPNTSWTNEPYGLIYYQGKYHLFFQKNPNGPFLYFMHWGHLSSPDLVNWTEEKIALAPTPGFDSFGVWSGTSVMGPDNKPVLIYTGVDGAKAGMGIAYPQDEGLIEWKKYENNPVIAAPPAGYAHMDFRDPYVWKTGNTYYMIVGSGLHNTGGILFTYKSTDLKNWQSIAPLYSRTDIDVTGRFWEMPFFIPIGDNKYILQVLPTPWDGKRAISLYWIGRFENEKFIPDFQKPKEMELISENMLAPAIGWDEENRITYIGILPEDRDVNAQVAAGWRHTFTIPRVTRLLKDSTLGFYPHPNLCRLRTNERTISNRVINRNTNFNLSEISGNQMELKFSVKADSASRFLIQVFKHADAQEFISLVFDLKRNKIGLDRRFSTLSVALKDNKESDYIFNFKENINVHIYLDRSTLEVFVDNVVVFSCRAYPSRIESNKVDLVVSDGRVELLELKAWDMMNMNQTTSVEICEPSIEELPEMLRKKITSASPVTSIDVEEVRQNTFTLYPNPALDSFTVDFAGERLPEGAVLTLYTPNGRVIKQLKVSSSVLRVNVEELPAGVYFAKIGTKKQSQIFKVVITK